MFEEIDDLDDPRFAMQFTSFTDSAWRLETLDSYAVAYEQDAYDAFLDGDASRIGDAARPWIEHVIAPAVAADRYIGRVHVIERVTDAAGEVALSDYLRFEFEFYQHTKAAGEDIRIAWTEPGTWPPDVWMPGSDFWLFDAHTADARLMEMHYTPDGAFRKAVITDHPEIVDRAHRCSRAAQAASKPFYP